MRQSQKLTLILLISLFAGMFAFMAIYLVQKQKDHHTLSSFYVKDEKAAILFNDIDRLCSKIRLSEQRVADFLPEELNQGLIEMSRNEDFSFNSAVSERLYLSRGNSGYAVVFDNPELSASYLLSVIKENFDVDCALEGNTLTIGDYSFQSKEFGNYLTLSTTEVLEKEDELASLPNGNTDFVVIVGDSTYQGHILTEDYHFTVVSKSTNGQKSRAVSHRDFMSKIPAEFDEIHYWGGSRFQEDLHILFEEPKAELFSWMDQGMLLIKKSDSMEILLSRQNEERDLRMILEEQTMSMNADSAQINTFNIGSFEVMYFETKDGWHKSISELDSKLTYYAEHENFNVLANSIQTMRWFLAEYQQDNFFLSNEALKTIYSDAIPEKLNYLNLTQSSNGLSINTKTNSFSEMIWTHVDVNQNNISENINLEIQTEFPAEIVPTKIQILREVQKEKVLLNNKNQLVMYTFEGEKLWRLDLSTQLNSDPQLIDFENDGIHEFALFQTDQLDIVDASGQSLKGFPIKLNNGSQGGIALNYDRAFNYRLLVSNGNQIQCYNESGKSVMGWMFKEMSTSLNSPIAYRQVAGKDYINFTDKNGVDYRLNRRGENRFKTDSKKSIRNENDQILGSNESNLRKMGYSKQYIYSHYIKDGKKDSTKLDERINPTEIIWKSVGGQPIMIVEELERTLTFDEFGYKKSEILKESSNQEILDVFGTQDFLYLFFDNRQNKLYLRDVGGQLLTGKPIKGSRTSEVIENRLITFVGNKIKVYKLY